VVGTNSNTNISWSACGRLKGARRRSGLIGSALVRAVPIFEMLASYCSD